MSHDLTQCEREPIHVPGAIQNHGALIAVLPQSRIVTHVSSNLERILGLRAEAALGLPLEDVIGEAAYALLEDLCDAAALKRNIAIGECPISERGDGRSLRMQGHRSGRFVCIDIEPVTMRLRQSRHLAEAQSMMDSLSSATTRIQLCELAVRGLKALTGYDRVMAYRFHEDDHGEVVAEAASPLLEPCLGLHYPVSDIPRQARALYLRQLVGEISNTGEPPVPLLTRPMPGETIELDLTHSALRSVSPMCLEYMSNMKVAASLRIGLTHNQKLWGLLVAHHATPRIAGPEVRALAEMIGRVLSLLLGSVGEAEVYAERLGREAALRRIVNRLATSGPLPAALAGAESEILGLVGADGALLRVFDTVHLIGSTPPPAAAERALSILREDACAVTAWDDVGLRHPQLADCRNEASGAMLLPLESGTKDAILWFKPEWSRTIRWGGNPAEHAIVHPIDGKLHPRTSFAAWAEQVTGRSAPWAEADVALATELGRAIEAAAAQRTKAELAAIVAGSNDAIIGLTVDGIVTSWNAAAEQIFEYTAKEMIGRPLVPIVTAEQPNQVGMIHVQPTLAIPLNNFETIWLAKSGRRIDVSLTDSPVRDAMGNVVGASKIVRDISERRLAENALSAANKELQKALAAAESAKRAKSDFLATISHEIRSPLSGLVGVIELLRETNLEPGQDHMASMAHGSAMALMAVLNDVLDFSKIEAGALTILREAIRLRELVGALVQPHALQAGRNNVELVVRFGSDLPDAIMTDPLRLRQILNNLLSNAVKFTAHGNIALDVDLTREASGTKVRFVVRDTGIGMTDDVQAKLFEPFVQADSSTMRKFGGTGLGLSISRKLAGLLEGTLDVVSAEGVGSVFTLDLPLIPLLREHQPAEVADASLRPLNLVGGGRVLVVDDDSTLRWLCRRQLEQMGLHADVAEDGTVALTMLKEGAYALLLTDCHMPKMDGVTLTRTIRAASDPVLRSMPVIGLTADVTEAQRRSCREAGMTDIAIKPLNRAGLSHLLAAHLPGIEPVVPTAPADSRADPEGLVSFDDGIYRDLFSIGDPEGEAWLEEYLKTADDFTSELHQCFSAPPDMDVARDTIAATAHSLAGTSLSVGAKGLGEAARRLEYAAQDEDRVALDALFGVVQMQLAETKSGILAYIAGV